MSKIGTINFDTEPESFGWIIIEDGANENPMVCVTLKEADNYLSEQGYYNTGTFEYGSGFGYTYSTNDDQSNAEIIPLDKSHYESLPGIVCEQLDGLIPHHEVFTNFTRAWNEYVIHVLTTDMDNVKMPGYVFNKYKTVEEIK